MATLKLKKGTSAQIDSAGISDGTLYIATDKAKIAYDIDGSRKIVNDTNTNTTYSLSKSGSTITLTGSDGKTSSVTDSNTTYNAGTGISLSGTTFSNSGVRSIATGSSNGTISVNTNGTSTDVSVKGLGSAAYTNTSAYVPTTTDGTNAAINRLTTGDSNPTDNDYYIAQYAGGGTTTTTYHRRPISKLWNYIKSKADSVYSALGHTHTKSQITDFPTSLPASDVYSWAKAASKPSYTKSEVGLGNVDNTADVNKSVKYAASAGSVPASGITGTISESNLPSYVDDVLEYEKKSSFPATGESGKIYVDATTNLTYRWGGSAYVEISPSLALGTTSSTAYRGDLGAAAYTHAVTNKGAAYTSGLYKITTNSEGHVIAATKVAKSDITALGIPSSDTNTHYASKNVVGSSTATANTTSALTNGNVYLNSVENGVVTSTHNIIGAGTTTVTTDAKGNICIDNTTYSSSGESLTPVYGIYDSGSQKLSLYI